MRLHHAWLVLGLVAVGCGEKTPVEVAGTDGARIEAPKEAVPPAVDHVVTAHVAEIERVFRVRVEAGTPVLPLCRLAIAPQAAGWRVSAACQLPESVRDGRVLQLSVSGCQQAHITTVADFKETNEDGVFSWSWAFHIGAQEAKPPIALAPGSGCVTSGSPSGLVMSQLPTRFRLTGPEAAALAYWEVQITQPEGLSAIAGATRAGQVGGQVTIPVGPSADLSLAILDGLAALEVSAGHAPLKIFFGRDAEGQASALGSRLRRGLETIERLMGPGPKDASGVAAAATVIITDALVPFEAVAGVDAAFVGFDPGLGAASLSFSEVLAGADSAELLNTMLLQHPARLDVLELQLLAMLAQRRLAGKPAETPFARALQSGFGQALALLAITETGGDKARRRYREFAWTIPWQLAVTEVAEEPLLSSATVLDEATLGLKAAFLAEAAWQTLGVDAGRALTRLVLTHPALTANDLHTWITAQSPAVADGARFIATWLDGRELTASLGSFSLARFIEYAVVDGGLELLKASALEEVKQNPGILGSALDLLKDGQLKLDPLFDVVEGALGEHVGDGVKPWVEGALDAGRLILGVDAATRQKGTARLVDELGAELGLDEQGRAKVRMLADEVFKALDRDRPKLRAPTEEAPPVSP